MNVLPFPTHRSTNVQVLERRYKWLWIKYTRWYVKTPRGGEYGPFKSYAEAVHFVLLIKRTYYELF